MPSAAHVSYPADGVGLILIDNPPMNFATWELMEQIEAAVQAVKAAGSRVVVLASDLPGYFIAHASLVDLVAAFSGGQPSGDGRVWYPLLKELQTGSMIALAANNGQAWGGGSEISWACNLRIAAQSATYGQPESLLGIIPGAGGTTRLARLLGPARCLEMILEGAPITAQQALQWGAINRVVPDGRLRQETLAWAACIAALPAWAIEACKRSLLEGLDLPLDDALRNEGKIFGSVATRDDTLQIMRDAQSKYDAGANSVEALGLSRD